MIRLGIVKSLLKKLFYDKSSIDLLVINEENLGDVSYVSSYIETCKKIINCLNSTLKGPRAHFAGKILFYHLLPPMSVFRLFGITNQKMTHYTYGSDMCCIDLSIQQEGFFSRSIKLFRLINKFRSLSLFRSISTEGQYLLLSSYNVDMQKIQQMGYSIAHSEVPVLSLMQIYILLVKGKCKFTPSLQCLDAVLVDKIEMLISHYDIKRLGTVQLLVGVDFLENPVFQACDNTGVISFGRQQRVTNRFQLEWRYGYYHEYSYWDKESMLIHTSINHVENPLVDYAEQKLNIDTKIKSIIAFPGQYCKTLCACSFSNASMLDAFSKFLSCLTNHGYRIIVKVKDYEDKSAWEEKGFDVVTSSRGDYMNVLKDGFVCAVSSVCTTPGLEISIKTTLPSFYYSDDTIPSEYIGYEDMLVSSPAELFEKLSV
jgi:hypothetical protein